DPRVTRRPRRARRGHHPPRAAARLRRSRAARPQRLGGVRCHHARADIPSGLRPARPIVGPCARRAARPAPGAGPSPRWPSPRRPRERLAQLDARNRSEADRVRELERRETETAARLAAARDAERRATDQARTLLDRAKAEAAALLTDIRRAVSSEWERLKRTERRRPGLQESRRRLQDAAARVATGMRQPAARE